MERWKGKLAIVTGATTGIGAGICKELVKHGLTVFGVARHVEEIEGLSREYSNASGGVLHALKCDLTKDEEVYAVFDEIKNKFGSLHLCVNNAGISSAKLLLDGNPDEWRAILNLNVVALCLCSKLAVKSMLENDQDFGHIINIGSISGHKLTPCFKNNFYASSKFAVRAISEGLRQELRGLHNHIRVTCISPGPVSTGIHAKAKGTTGPTSDFVSYEVMEVEDIAEAVIYALSAHPRVDVNDILMRPTEMEV